MKRTILSLALALLFADAAAAQYPVLDRIADKVIEKYQRSSCEQLWQEKSRPKPPAEQEVIQKLRSEPRMREAFIDRVAGPIANKLFECGMIP